MQNIHSKTYKTLLKDIKEDPNTNILHFTVLCRYRRFGLVFIDWRVAATVHWTKISTLFFPTASLHASVIFWQSCSISNFPLLYLLWCSVISDLSCYYWKKKTWEKQMMVSFFFLSFFKIPFFFDVDHF